MGYRLLVNKERTVLVRMWDTGLIEVSTRPEEGDTWGPPVEVKEQS
jgi:hypothetical protein